jgi:PPOX class probable F420-dependent enzyme
MRPRRTKGARVPKLDKIQRAFIRDNPYYAVLTTLRADGSPHSTVVWVDEDDGDLVFNTALGRAKERHLAADPRASITVVDPANPYRWLAASGPVTMTTEGADAHIDQLARRYTGSAYASWREGETRVSGRLTPDHVEGVGL